MLLSRMCTPQIVTITPFMPSYRRETGLGDTVQLGSRLPVSGGGSAEILAFFGSTAWRPSKLVAPSD
eukprot:12423144-Alexandrium_andersonii.AAC.1